MALFNRASFAADARAVAIVLATGNLGAAPFPSAKIHSVIDLFMSQGCASLSARDQLLAAMELRLGGAPTGVGFVVPVQKGTPERLAAILAAAKTAGL
jgi:hypothetical protein